ncbi:MAG: SMI1/KNR4 family protein [Candidatus Riflebacteria bacterium]|nr:SMI1/KNR4 family protein [Candidatus Riflebacteria bacterium]
MDRVIIQEFIEYVRAFSPTFVDSISGATEEEVQLYERLVGRPLPPVYREFLLAMGRDFGGLELFAMSTTDIRRLIQVYQTEVPSQETIIPPDCVLMALEEFNEQEVLLQGPMGEEPRVVFSAGGYVVEQYAESLGKLLFRHAFVLFRQEALPHRRSYAGGRSDVRVLREACELALGLGFAPLWFSDSFVFCGETDRASIVCDQGERSSVWVKVTAQVEADADRIGAEFARRFGLNPQARPGSP